MERTSKIQIMPPDDGYVPLDHVEATANFSTFCRERYTQYTNSHSRLQKLSTNFDYARFQWLAFLRVILAFFLKSPKVHTLSLPTFLSAIIHINFFVLGCAVIAVIAITLIVSRF